jgi:hypothetical protein
MKAQKPIGTNQIRREREQQIAALQAQVKTLETLVEAKFDATALKSGDVLLLRNIEMDADDVQTFQELLRRNGLKDILFFVNVTDEQYLEVLDADDRRRLIEVLQDHTAPYPRMLAANCILAGSNKGDIVLDPFFGAGTTGVACKTLGRKYLGIELNPKYIDIAKRRIDAMPESLFD